MSDGAGIGLVERAGDAAARGEWKQAFDLLMEADADGLTSMPGSNGSGSLFTNSSRTRTMKKSDSEEVNHGYNR